jgi:hypothetical protein
MYVYGQDFIDFCVLTSELEGRGVKVCPQVDSLEVTTPHRIATRELIQEQLKQYAISGVNSPASLVFKKTAALITALRNIGCLAERQESTKISLSETALAEKHGEFQQQRRRGFTPKHKKCVGRVVLDIIDDHRAIVK